MVFVKHFFIKKDKIMAVYVGTNKSSVKIDTNDVKIDHD